MKKLRDIGAFLPRTCVLTPRGTSCPDDEPLGGEGHIAFTNLRRIAAIKAQPCHRQRPGATEEPRPLKIRNDCISRTTLILSVKSAVPRPKTHRPFEANASLFEVSAARFGANVILFEANANLVEPNASLFEQNASVFKVSAARFEARTILFEAPGIGFEAPGAEFEGTAVPWHPPPPRQPQAGPLTQFAPRRTMQSAGMIASFRFASPFAFLSKMKRGRSSLKLAASPFASLLEGAFAAVRTVSRSCLDGGGQ